MDWKKTGRKILFPPIWLILILSVISAAALVRVFVKGWEQTYIAYVVYALAFYTLSVATCFFVFVFPKKYGRIKEKIYENPFGKRYMTDDVFRGKISLYLSLIISLLYVGIHMLSWYFSRSWWFVVLAVYYVIMAIMRFLLVRYVRLNEIGTGLLGEWRRARICAYILLLINLCLSGAVLMILYQNRGYDYPGIMIYVMAMYTFYAFANAIVELVKYRTMGSPVMSTAKVIALSAALVSMLNLETAMFAQFGADMSVENQHIFIILTGAGVSATVVSLCIILIARATKEIRRENYGK